MKRVTLIVTALLFAVLAVLTTRVVAQETNTQERSFLTFSNTVEMPGVTLPAGTYVFRLADTPTRNVVQVLSQDEKKVLGQWLFVQAERPEVTDDTVVMFKETAENTTPAIQYWYFPGEKIGKEFVYPKDQAEKIASRTGQKVRTETGYVTPDHANASNAPQPSSTVASNDTSTVQGPGLSGIPEQNNSSSTSQASADQDRDRDRGHQTVGTSGTNEQNNQAVGPSGANTQNNGQSTTTNSRQRLPKTASPLPLSGLIGLLSLVGALGVRKYSAAQNS